MGQFTDDAFETGAVVLNETIGLYAGSSTPDVDAPDAPEGSVYYRSNGQRYTRTQNTGSGVAEDWVLEDPEGTGGGAAVQLSWRFSTSTTEANPGSKRIRFDNATPASVTKIFINDTTNNNFDASALLNALQTGDRIYVQESSDATAFLLATVDTITDNVGWFTLEVTPVTVGVLPTNNRDVGVLLLFGGGVTTWNGLTGTADRVPFTTGLSNPAHNEGWLFYDDTEKTVAIYNDEADVTHQLGQEHLVRVYNNSGVTINNGQIVYISGSEGVENRPTIGLARADAQNTSKVIGWATHDIEDSTFGYITELGLVNGLNTSAFSAGDTLWLDETTAGAVRDTPPPDGNFEVEVGFVVRVDASLGRVLVFIQENLGSLIGDASDLILDVRKESVGTIVGGGVTTVELADASSASTMPAIGIARNTITNTVTGQIVVFGKLSDVATNLWSVGDALYVDTTAGDLTNVRPTGTALVQQVGIVARSNPTNGVIELVGAGRANALPNLPTDNIWIGDGSGVPTTLQNNLSAVVDPTATDDSAAGYAVGSRWINVTDDQEFVCVDATATAAVWIETTSVSIEDDMDGVQARRTTDFTITGTFADITLDTTDVENAPATVEHDNTNTERLNLIEAGLYLIYYGSTAVASSGVSEASNDVLFRVQLNGAGGAVAGSEDRVKTFFDSSIINDDLETNAVRSFLYDATANDFLTLQAQVANVSGTITTVARLTSFGAIKLTGKRGADGQDGAQGPPGSGSTITVEDEDVAVPNTPHSILNFTGAGVTVTDAGGGQADITIPGGGGAGVANDAVQARRSTTLALAAAFQDITLDATDVETDAAVIEHNNTNTDDIDIKVAGTYEITYHAPIDTSGLGNGDTWDITGRIRVNDTGGALAGSTSFVTAWQDASVDGSDFGFFLEKSVIATLAASDKVTLQIDTFDNSADGGVIGLLAGTTLSVKRLV
jgi:hypothetical protein